MNGAGCESCGAVVDAAVSDDLKVMVVVVEGGKDLDSVSSKIFSFSHPYKRIKIEVRFFVLFCRVLREKAGSFGL